MGFLKKVFGAKEVLIDPADLRIPQEVATDKPGLTLKKAPVVISQRKYGEHIFECAHPGHS